MQTAAIRAEPKRGKDPQLSYRVPILLPRSRRDLLSLPAGPLDDSLNSEILTMGERREKRFSARFGCYIRETLSKNEFSGDFQCFSRPCFQMPPFNPSSRSLFLRHQPPLSAKYSEPRFFLLRLNEEAGSGNAELRLRLLPRLGFKQPIRSEQLCTSRVFRAASIERLLNAFSAASRDKNKEDYREGNRQCYYERALNTGKTGKER